MGQKWKPSPHPRDFMGPKWQDRVWSGDIKSGVCKMKCSALRFYATLSHISIWWDPVEGVYLQNNRSTNYIHKKGIIGKVETRVIDKN